MRDVHAHGGRSASRTRPVTSVPERSMTSHERRTHERTAYTPAVPSKPAISGLLAALGDATAEPTLADLHRVVCERVREMRDAGAHPEAVLASIKGLAVQATLD